MHANLKPAPALSAKYVLRGYLSDRQDEKEIVDVFNLVFGGQRTVAHWKWKYADNPYAKPMVSVACDAATGKIVGHYTAIPVLWNIKGEAQLGCQSVDTLVHPEHRLQGLFEATAADFFKQCEQKKMVGVFGFPGEASYPGFIRKLGWHRISPLKAYTRRLNLYPELRRLVKLPPVASLLAAVHRFGLGLRLWNRVRSLRRRLGGDVQWQESATVPIGYDLLWQAVKSHEVISVWKDARYFSWRYDQHPDRRYRYHYLSRAGKIIALCVVNTDSEIANICELVSFGKDVLAAKYLVYKLALTLLRKRRWRLVFQGKDLGFFDEVFADFEQRLIYNFLLCGKLFESGHALGSTFAHADNWTIVQGDSDHV